MEQKLPEENGWDLENFLVKPLELILTMLKQKLIVITA